MTQPDDTPVRSRRSFLALGARAAGLGALGAIAAPFIAGSRLKAETALTEIPPIPERLKGSGELRIAAYGGTAQDAERKAYFEPFERLAGVRTRDFPGADVNK